MSEQNSGLPRKKPLREKTTSQNPSGKNTAKEPKKDTLPVKSTQADDMAPENFKADINQLVNDLKVAIGEGASRWYYDEPSETLYVELEALAGMTEDEIEQKAGPVLDECDLDFEEIILLPYSR